MADPTPSAVTGTVGGHYKLLSKLGEGAFGEVFRAQHELLEQEFAVKILRAELCEDQQVRDRFLDEARALIRFNHGNVVQLRHVGEHEGRLFLVMDFVRGEALNDVLRVEGPFEERRAVEFMDQVLAGLAAAHAVGIVHRDLKPSNLIVEKRPDGTQKIHILDFGLARLSAVGDGMKSAHRSVSGSIIGTLAYMSPEQIQGQTVDQRSDVFAAGLVLMEMLQGHHPYPGDSGIMVAARLLRDPIPPLDPKVSSKVSATTRTALSTALERDRDARFPSATAFAHALQGKGPPSDTSRVTTIEQARQDLARADAKAALEKAHQQVHKKKRSGVVVGLTIAALAAVGGWYFLMGPGKAKEGTTGGSGGGTEVARAPEAASPPPGLVTKQPETPATAPAPKQPEPTAAPAAAPTPTPAPKEPDPTPAAAPSTPPPEPPTPASAPAPSQPTPKEPEPGPKEPDPAPAPVPTPVPEAATPPAPTPTPVAHAPAAVTADALQKSGDDALAKGSWAAAKSDYRAALTTLIAEAEALTRAGDAEKAREKNQAQIPALQRASMAALAEADVLARSGNLPEAQKALGETIDWLGGRYLVYEKARTDMDEGTQNRLRGFARLFRAQAHSERMRWNLVAGAAPAAAKERQAADDDFELAWQFLQRDSIPYWEFLIRRGEHRFLSGAAPKAMEDLAITTQTANTKVPVHMWIAHARGARRTVEMFMFAPKPDMAGALAWAKNAVGITTKGLSWTEQRGEHFTQDQWLEADRVLWLTSTLETDKVEMNSLHGRLKYWVEETAKTAPAAHQHPDVTKAKILTAKAALDTTASRLAHLLKKPADASARAAAAEKNAREAVALAEAVGKAGGPLPAAFPYRVLADALRLQGKAEDAAAADKAALAAGARNPD